MKRFQPASTGMPPEPLLIFRPGDWPPGTTAEKLTAWKDARAAWADTNPWPSDPISFVVEQFRARRTAHRLPGNPQDATPDQRPRWL